MIDKMLDRITNYKVKVMEAKATRLEKQFAAEQRLAAVEKKREKIRPKRTYNAQGKPKGDFLDKLADFGEGCGKAADSMNNNLFGEPKK